MGLYDYLNGEQIKFFYTVGIGMPDFVMPDTCLHYMGGSLNYYDKGTQVPYRSLHYNYGKNFNIIHLHPYEVERPIVHVIRSGINVGAFYLEDVADDVFAKSVNYDARGTKLNIKTNAEAVSLLEAHSALQEAWKTEKRDAWEEYMDYFRSHSTEERATDEYKKKMDEFQAAVDREREENHKMLEPFREAISKFVVEQDEEILKYETFGALVDSLYRYGKRLVCDIENNKVNFVVSDERLTFIVAYNQMMDIYKNNEEFIMDYYKALKFNKTYRSKFRKMFKYIHNAYEIIYNYVPNKSAMFEKYTLKDILKGRYKDFYEKYNVTPYKGFDYDIWNNLEDNNGIC